jgi:diguanylate cyclase (GGDEF)-like protein
MLRKGDFLFRYEGDEFLILLPDTSAQDARTMAEKIRSNIEKTNFLHKKEKIRITISIGLAEVSPKEPSAQALFGRAEKALYKAKEAGRNRVAVAPA